MKERNAIYVLTEKIILFRKLFSAVQETAGGIRNEALKKTAGLMGQADIFAISSGYDVNRGCDNLASFLSYVRLFISS